MGRPSFGVLTLRRMGVGQRHLLAPSLQTGLAKGLEEAKRDSLPEEKSKKPGTH